MRNEYEMDLVDLVEQELEASPELEQPNVWESEVTQYLADAREAKEAEAMRRGPRVVPHGLTSPRRVAEEMLNRSSFLRSKRGARYTKQRELEILTELDTIEAQARALLRQQEMGEVSGAQVAAEMEMLTLAVFAVRGRYADLLDAQDPPFPARAKPQDPGERKRELAEIEAFLARKKARSNDPKAK